MTDRNEWEPLTARPAVSLVIPTWNGLAILQRFLPSVVREAERWRDAGGQAEVVISDDGSTDDTLTWLARQYPQVRVTASAVNRGFAAAANAAVLHARYEIVVLLNSDVEVLPGLLDVLPSHFEDDGLFGVTFRGLDLPGWDDPKGPGTPFFSTGGKLGRFRVGFWSVWDNYDVPAQGSVPLPTFFLHGGFCALRRSVFAGMGGFDLEFSPYYWEDVDLSYRARKRGWRVVYEPRAQVCHALSATVKRHSRAFARAVVIHRNRLLFHWMNLHGPSLARQLVWSHLLLLQLALKGEFSYHCGWWQAVWRLPAILRRRRRDAPWWVYDDDELAVKEAPGT